MSNNKKTNNVFINHYSAEMVHIQNSTDKKGNNRQFASVSFAYPESSSGYATFSVNMGQLLPAKKKDGTIVNGRYSILLGNPDKERTVSVANNGSYNNIKLTNNQIAEYINGARNAYASLHVA